MKEIKSLNLVSKEMNLRVSTYPLGFGGHPGLILHFDLAVSLRPLLLQMLHSVLVADHRVLGVELDQTACM